MASASLKLSLGARIALAGAAVWGLLLIGLGFLPTYESVSTSSAGVVTRTTETLVSENGYGVLVLLAVPLVMTGAVTVALSLRARRGALVAAWVLTGLLAAFALLSMLTVGVVVLPVLAGLVVACTLCTMNDRGPAARPTPTAA